MEETVRMKQLKTLDDWYDILNEAEHRPLILFKFSATCVASVSAYKEMNELKSDLPIYLIIVQNARDVSNAIEADLGVRHESPQVLIMNNGRAIWQATHYKIKAKEIDEAIDQYVK